MIVALITGQLIQVKKILDNYTKIIDEIKDQILFITEDDLFVMVEILQDINLKLMMIYIIT